MKRRLVLLFALLQTQCQAFTSLLSSRRAIFNVRSVSDDDEEFLFDDFDGQIIGENSDAAKTTPTSLLQSRLQNLKDYEEHQGEIESRNWDYANWQVSGIAWNTTIATLTVDEDGSLIVADVAGTITRIKLLERDDGEEQRYEILSTLQTNTSGIIDVIDDEDRLIVASPSGLQLWEQDSLIRTIASNIIFVKLLPNNRLLAVGANSIEAFSLETGETLSNIAVEAVTCAGAGDDFVYVGTASGSVQSFSIDGLHNGETTEPVAVWKVNRDDVAVTAVAVGESTQLGGKSARIVLTGDGSGVVQQWFIIENTQVWPKMRNQKLPDKSHVFQGHGDSVMKILSVDDSKFVTASVDGSVRAWNAKSGAELFRLEGFQNPIQSVCMLDSTLILATSKGFDIQDFSIENDDDDFDLDMPEYRKEAQ